MSNVFRGGWITCTKQYFGELPIAVPDPAPHDEVVSAVERMLTAKKEWATMQGTAERNRREQECAALDRQIDRLVYDLYGLSEEEIALVEAPQAADEPEPARSKGKRAERGIHSD